MEPIKILQGTVAPGQHRGKDMGFPTMNIPLTEEVEEGVYFSYIIIVEKQYNALTFIGPAKTFHETKPQAETYVLDFDEDVYGKTVTVLLLKKLRENIQFDSAEALVRQMKEDKKQAENFFNSLK